MRCNKQCNVHHIYGTVLADSCFCCVVLQGGYPPQPAGYPPQQPGGYPPQQVITMGCAVRLKVTALLLVMLSLPVHVQPCAITRHGLTPLELS